MTQNPRTPLHQKGFTIIELMIATVVFSVVLLVVTYGILQISRTYYKGVNESATQTVARTIIDNIGQSIQFNGGDVAITNMDSKHAFCIGNQRYSFLPGWMVIDGDTPDAAQHQTKHGLYVEDGVEYCGSSLATHDVNNTTMNAIAGGRELLSPNMRLAKLTISQDTGNSNQYKITIRVIYGQDDFIYSPSDDTTEAPTKSDATCKGSSAEVGKTNAGTAQFCSISELSTTVTKRVK